MEYFRSSVFLASFSLSILYLTVLSTSVSWQTYMLAINYSSISVSFFRVAAVLFELTATCFAPLLMDRIGPIRTGLWSINWQVIWLAGAVLSFYFFNDKPQIAGAGLTAGIVASRLGLWGFDLSVQFIVQDVKSAFSFWHPSYTLTKISQGAPSSSRGRFSACEMALQNLFELLSFASIIVAPRPDQFFYPILVSYFAVVLAAACFAAFVRMERGHLFHASRCMKREKYNPVFQIPLDDM